MMCTPLGVLYMIKRNYVNYLKYGIIIRIRKLNEYAKFMKNVATRSLNLT